MDLTLVVMAAGMGSRFGGLKQIAPVDEDGNYLIDYSIYDAIEAGFIKVVFVIQEENLRVFEETIGNRLKSKVQIEYAFQKIDAIPSSLIDIKKRNKPWGTVQAILAAKPFVSGSFAVINADDFYGKNAYVEAVRFLKNVKSPYTYANISYSVGKTKSLKGTVKRAVLSCSDEKITSIIESEISFFKDNTVATPLNGETSFSINEDTPVSMNFFAFQNDVFSILEEYWENYFKQSEEKIMNGEALLPVCINENLIDKKITLINVPGNSEWLGMTYHEDLDFVKKSIQNLKDKQVYKTHLWEDYCGKE